MKKIIYAIIVLQLLGCNSKKNNEVTIKDIAIKDTLKGEKINVSQKMLMPTKVVAINDKLIICDNTKDSIFKVFKLPEMTLSYSFGHYGNGPEEFSRVDFNTIKKMGSNLVFLDNRKILSYKIGVDKAQMLNSLPIMLDRMPSNGLQMINDSIYITDVMDAKPFSPEHRKVNIFDRKVIAEFGEYPEKNNNTENGIDTYAIYKKASVSNPSTGEFASFYFNFDKVNFYDATGNILQKINIENNFPDFFSNKKKNKIIFRAEPYATSKFIYVLNVEKSKKEVEENITAFTPKFEIWDWNGNLVDKYVLDKPITGFAVSEKYNKIYGVSFANMSEIYEFSLPAVSHKTKQSSYKSINSKTSQKGTQSEYKSTNSTSTKKIENDLFTINIPSDWNYSTATPENEKDKITHDQFFSFNTNVFTIPRGSDNCGGSITVVIAFKKNNETALEDFLHHRHGDLKKIKDVHDLNIQTNNIKKNKVMTLSYSRTFIEPNGEKTLLKTYERTWKSKDYFIEIIYNSCSLYEKNFNVARKTISTFQFKK